VAHLAAETEVAGLALTKLLLSYLPQNNDEDPPQSRPEDPPNRMDESLNSLIPDDENQPHDVRDALVAIFDHDSFLMKLLTTQAERRSRVPYSQRVISRRTRVLFPIVVTVLVGTLVPFATPLIGMPMLGNLMKASGVVERLTKASANEIANTVTLFLGLAIGSSMVGTEFLKPSSLAILVLGIVAFAVDGIACVRFAKLLNKHSGAR